MKPVLTLTVALVTLTVLGCASPRAVSPISVSNPSVFSSTSLTLLPSGGTIAAGSSVQFTASGGSGDYTYSAAPTSCTIGSTTGIFLASSVAQTCLISVTDNSNGTSANTTATISATTSTNTLTISPLNPTVSESSITTLTVSGGTAPYTYTLVSDASTGTLVGNVYTAPNTITTAVIQVKDAAGNAGTSSIFVSSTGTTATNYTYALNNVVLSLANSLNVLDLKSKSHSDLATIQQWRYLPPDDKNQIWNFQPAGTSGGYEIISSESSKCVELADQSFGPGDLIVQDTCTGKLNQIWSVSGVSTYEFEIVHQNSGYCLGVIGSSTAQGARLELEVCNGAPNQLFRSYAR